MKYLKITFVRILLSFFAANMALALVTNDSFEVSSYLIYRIILMVVFYYGLTLYVNNKKSNKL